MTVDLAAWLLKHSVPVLKEIDWPGDGERNPATVYEVPCPFSPEDPHNGTPARVWQDPVTGVLYATCHHGRCQGKATWRNFRAIYEPGYDPNREYETREDAPSKNGHGAGGKSGSGKPGIDALIDRLVAEERERLCYSRAAWQRYEAGVWTALEGKEGYQRPYRIVREAADAGEFNYTWHLVNEVHNGASVELTKPADIWDRHAHKLAFTNVTLNLETYKQEPHSPQNYITAGVPYAYDPQATGPNWDRYTTYLREHPEVGPEVLDFLQEYLGYCLTADASAEIMLFIVGKRGSGKSTFIEGAEAMLGRDLIMTQSVAGLGERFGRAGIIGKRLILSKEMSTLKLLETDAVSNIVSGERIRIEHKGVDGYDYTPVAKIIQAANDLPRVPNTEAGIYRRLQVIRFPDLEVAPDPKLKEGIKAEGPYILNWALKGLKRLQERGGFEIPDKVKADSGAWRDENNVIKMFLDACVEDGDKTIRTSEIHALYHRWCDHHQYKTLSLGEFSKRGRREAFFEAHARKHRNVSVLAKIDLTEEGYFVNESGYKPAIDFAAL